MWLSKLLMPFAIELEKFDGFLTNIKNEAVPGLSDQLLEEWETDLGLDNTCSAGLVQTKIERAAIAHAKHVANYDGQSAIFFLTYAESLGFTVQITNSPGGTPFRVGVNRVGDRLGSARSRFRWQVEVFEYSTTVSIDYLQCRFAEMQPAHTEITWVL